MNAAVPYPVASCAAPAYHVGGLRESLDPFRADRILALDERLTRQFGKTLTLLIQLRELRSAVPAAA